MKNKILVVPDVHGRNIWKKAASKLVFGEVDQIIFVGDYFDSFNIDGKSQIENFKDIIKFKKDNPDTVTLLTGNHDLQYITDMACSGYQAGNHWTIKNLLQPLMMEDELKMIKIIGDHIFIHAGLGKDWCDRYRIDLDNLEESVNSLFKRNPIAFDFQEPPKSNKLSNYIYISGYGDNVWQSPVWIRPDSLYLSKLDGYTQVVGHTHIEKPTLKNGVWMTDCHDYKNEDFLILEL